MRKFARHPRHHPAGAQHRQVERSAVERGETFGALELLAQRVQKRRFHPGFGQKELRDAKAAVDGRGDSRGEDVGARSAPEPGRLGVDVGDGTWVRVESRQRDHVLPHRGGPER